MCDYDDYADYFEDFEEVEDEIKDNNKDECTKEIDKKSILSEILSGGSDDCEHKNINIFPKEYGGTCEDCGIIIKDINKFFELRSSECKHISKIQNSSGYYVCQDCGIEIEIYDYSPEWRSYSTSGGKYNPRCKTYNYKNKNIELVFEKHDINVSPFIISEVEDRYCKCVQSTYRGKNRDAIIAVCYYFVLKDFGEYRTTDYIRSQFGLKKKDISFGLNRYYELYSDVAVDEVTPKKLIKWKMDLVGLDIKDHYYKITRICDYIQNASEPIIKSAPQSIAVSVIYFYLCDNKELKSELGLTKKKFAKKALISDITINKLVKEIARLCGKEDIIA